MAGSGLGVIQVDNEFIVVGGERCCSLLTGDRYEPTESCKINQHSMICATREPIFARPSFAVYPELMLIP